MLKNLFTIIPLSLGLSLASYAQDRIDPYLPDELHQPELEIHGDNGLTLSPSSHVAATYHGYTGLGYIEMEGSGTWIEWNNVEGGPGGNCKLTFRFSNGSNSARPCVIKVNGVVVATVDFMPSGSWSSWQTTVEIPATLSIGNRNSIRVEATSAAGGPAIDSLNVMAACNLGEPDVQFVYETNGTSVQFTDNSIDSNGGITSSRWDFGDGETSTELNPNHNYQTPGVYGALRTVTNAAGKTAFRIKTIDLRRPNTRADTYCGSTSKYAAFEYIDQVVIGKITYPSIRGLYEPFLGTSFDIPPGVPCSVLLTPAYTKEQYLEYWAIWIDWNGDGKFEGDDAQPVFTAWGEGPVSGNFTIPSSARMGETRMRIAMQYNAPPTVCGNFEHGEVIDYGIYITSTCRPPAASFDCISKGSGTFFYDRSTNPEGWNLTYCWQFGDGSESKEKNPFHTYSSPGIYKVTLTVTNDCTSHSTTKDITTTCLPPTASFDFTSWGDRTSFYDHSTNPGDSNLKYCWQFGDGSESKEKNPFHIYSSPGIYNVTLTVTNDCTSHSTTKPVLFSYVDFSWRYPRDLTVSFEDTSTVANVVITTWHWEFGDGTTSDEQHPSHTYLASGTYTVILTVTGNDKLFSRSITHEVNVPDPKLTGINFHEMENNDAFPGNTVPDTTTRIDGSIFSADDVDYFKVSVLPNQTLTVNMTGRVQPSGRAQDYDLFLLDSAQKELTKSIGPTATESLTYQNTSNSTVSYIIKVTCCNKVFHIINPEYTLTLTRNINRGEPTINALDHLF